MAAGDPALKGGSFCRHPTRADRDIRNTTTLTRSQQPLSDVLIGASFTNGLVYYECSFF